MLSLSSHVLILHGLAVVIDEEKVVLLWLLLLKECVCCTVCAALTIICPKIMF